MDHDMMIERLFIALISGDRAAARSCLDEATGAGIDASGAIDTLLWPALTMIDRLSRADQLSDLARSFATETLRMLVAGLACSGTSEEGRQTRSVLVSAGCEPVSEIAGQIMACRLERAGYSVAFAAGGVPVEDLLSEVADRRPVALVLYAISACEAPAVRELIDRIRDVGACPDLRIFAGGGVFERVEGLAEEIGSDACIDGPDDLLKRLSCSSTAARRSRMSA